MNNRVSSLEQWKYYVIGGAIVIGYLIGHVDFFEKFFK